MRTDGEGVVLRGKPGAVGYVKWAYYTAATLHGYTLTRHPGGGWIVGGHVGERNPFNLTQTPLVFEVPTKGGAFRWPVVSVHLQADYLTACLGETVEAVPPARQEKELIVV